MRKPVRLFRTAAAVVALSAGPLTGTGAVAAPLDSGGAQRVPINSTLRFCDYSVRGPTNFGYVPSGRGEAVIRRSGDTVIADIQFVQTEFPGAHYDVVLVQVPRPPSEACGPGAPDTASAGLDIDAAGRGAVTVADRIHARSTDVWVKIESPNPYSQLPAEYYSTTHLVGI